MILLQRHYQTKVKKDCPMFAEMTLQDVQDAAKCMESSYRFSLLIQKLSGDVGKFDKKAIITDVDNIFVQLPSVLDTCGKSDWANEVRKYLPMDCIHAVEDFVAELAVVEHNYSHMEWLVRNYKDVEAYVAMVRMHCPFVY